MQKLTLSVDAGVIARAKAHAEARGTSVSRLVETMLRLISTKDVEGAVVPPVLGRLRGSLSKGTVADYHAHLEKKYK